MLYFVLILLLLKYHIMKGESLAIAIGIILEQIFKANND